MKQFDLTESIKQILEIVRVSEKVSEGNERLVLVGRIINDAYNKGRRKGHNTAIELSKNALDRVERANSNIY